MFIKADPDYYILVTRQSIQYKLENARGGDR